VVAAPLSVELGETLPHDPAEQETVQLTPLSAGSLMTVGVKACWPLAIKVAVAGETLTEMAGGGGVALDDPHPRWLMVKTAQTKICSSSTRFFVFISTYHLTTRFPVPLLSRRLDSQNLARQRAGCNGNNVSTAFSICAPLFSRAGCSLCQTEGLIARPALLPLEVQIDRVGTANVSCQDFVSVSHNRASEVIPAASRSRSYQNCTVRVHGVSSGVRTGATGTDQ